MIAKIIKGKGFRGLVEYIHQTPAGGQRGQLLATNLSGNTPQEWAREFGLVRRLRPTLGKAVFHASLSPAPGDPPLRDEDLAEIAREFLSGMGFPDDAPFVVIRHDDQAHPHIHIAASRITPSGGVVSDARDFQRAEALMRSIEVRRGLRQLQSSSAKPRSLLNRNRRRHMKSNTWPEPAEHISTKDIAPPREDDKFIGRNAEPWSEKRRREERRKLVEESYRNSVLGYFWNEVESHYFSQRAPSFRILFKDGCVLRDEGDRIRVGDDDDAQAARRLVSAAVAKRWTMISFSGSHFFVKEAMRLAIMNGMEVVPKDEQQGEWLEEVLSERSGVSGGMVGKLGTTPAPNHLPALDTNKLAGMRRQGPGRRSGSSMR